jgi:hypothetical protein
MFHSAVLLREWAAYPLRPAGPTESSVPPQGSDPMKTQSAKSPERARRFGRRELAVASFYRFTEKLIPGL